MKYLMPISILVCLFVASQASVHHERTYNKWVTAAKTLMDQPQHQRLKFCNSIGTAENAKSIYEESVKSLWNLASRGKSDLDSVWMFKMFLSDIGFGLWTSYPEVLINNMSSFLQKYTLSFDQNGDQKINFEEFHVIVNCLAWVEGYLIIKENKRMLSDYYKIDGRRLVDAFNIGMNASEERIPEDLFEELTRQLKPATGGREPGKAWTVVMDKNSIKEIAVFQIVIWDVIGEYFETMKHYQLLGKKHCVPNSAFPKNIYTNRYSAMQDCVENKKCAMINNQGCIENGKGVFQMCTGIFRDLRGNKRRQPLPSPKSCVLVKVKKV